MVDSFLTVSQLNHWDTATGLTNVVFFLAGTALTWFEDHENTFATLDVLWKAFQAGLVSLPQKIGV